MRDVMWFFQRDDIQTFLKPPLFSRLNKPREISLMAVAVVAKVLIFTL
jgi:hypothetical protein